MELLTAADSEVQQARVAGWLLDQGVRSGDRVLFDTTSRALMLSGLLGALRVGIVPVILNSTLTDPERSPLVANAALRRILDDQTLDATQDRSRLADMADAPLARPMHYTSGTTGQPKGVWSGVLDESDAAAALAEECELWGFESADRHLVVSPFHHSAPIRFGGGTLLAGGAVVVLNKFEVDAVASACAEARPTSAFMVPAHLQRLFAHGRSPDLASFRLLAHAGAPCPEAVKREALERFPSGSVWEFYGSTEGQFTACAPHEWLEHPGTVGRARTGRRLDIDADGVVWCVAPTHARFSYWQDPDRTAASWNGDAFTVGDLGRLDDGYLYLDGRRDDLIITGGVNVYPVEVEQVLLRHPDVRDVAVFGVDDETWGQRVCAAVVGEVDVAVLSEWTQTVLAPHKRPKEMALIDELPRTATGKVRRLELVAAYSPLGSKLG
jgi:acyl-CoA synthetase (AMP-forming)/AMP-acid ligase II